MCLLPKRVDLLGFVNDNALIVNDVFHCLDDVFFQRKVVVIMLSSKTSS